MKQYQDYKKHWLSLIVCIVVLALSNVPTFSSAESIEELNNKIEAKNTDIAKLEAEIALYQQELLQLGKQTHSLNVSIKELDLTKKKLNADISVTQNKIDRKNLEIIELSLDINDKEGSISNNIEALSFEIRKINEFDQHQALAIILSEENFTNLWNDIDNMATISRKIRDNTNALRRVKSNLEDTREETRVAKTELESLKTRLADQKKIVEQNTREKQTLLSQTKNTESGYQKLLKLRLETKEALEKEIEEYESQIEYLLNPSLLPEAGVLGWPLDNIYVTQQFGKTSASKRLYASGSHSGTDFRAAVGTPVYAVADGIVKGVGDTDKTCPYASFGKFVFIEHFNGLSTAYGHLSLWRVSEGQRVTRGQLIAYSGNTGHTTGPHLHLTVYAADAVKMTSRPSSACAGKTYTMPLAPRDAYLDPMYYLPKYDN